MQPNTTILATVATVLLGLSPVAAPAQDDSGHGGMHMQSDHHPTAGAHGGMHMQRDQRLSASAQGYMHAMVKMNDAMSSMRISGDADADFARMMFLHSQGTIDMARVELEHGKNEALKAMAQKIIEDQQTRIDELKVWLDQQPGVVVSD